jgi:hypothetical protein
MGGRYPFVFCCIFVCSLFPEFGLSASTHAGPPSAIHGAVGLLRASALLGPAPVPPRGRRGHPQPKRPRGHPQRARDGSAWGGSTTGAGPPSAPRWFRISDQAPSAKPLSLPSHKKSAGREPMKARGRGFLVYLPFFPLFRAYSRSLTPNVGVLAAASARRGVCQAFGTAYRYYWMTSACNTAFPGGVNPAAAPQAFLCIPAGRFRHPFTGRIALRDAVEPPPPQGRPPHQSSVGPAASTANLWEQAV